MANIGVIGASGFVGQHLSRELLDRGHTVRAIVRSAGSAPQGCNEVVVGDFLNSPDWDAALGDLETVVCLAARVHVMHETEADPLAAFRKINVEATRDIAESAVRVGTKRLIFVSSIKVNGENTTPGSPYHASDTPSPEDPYGISKLEAENMLREVSEDTNLEIAIIRPPLVYGAGVSGNFLKLLKLASTGVPLPLGSVNNSRAMIAVENLVDAIIHCSTVSLDGPTVVLVKDERSLSTAELLRLISSAGNRTSRLLPFPASMLEAILKVIGKQAEAERLLGSLDVTISSVPEGVDWAPPVSTEEAIQRTAKWYKDSVTK